MDLNEGDRVVAESESTERPPREGVIEEILGSGSSLRYRIRWADGHESIWTPASGALYRKPADREQKAGARA
jgi:hypothetical protein